MSENNLECNIKIHDIQFEEVRDLEFGFSTSTVDLEQFISFKEQKSFKKIILLSIDDKDKDADKRNEELDLQHNRLITSKAMKVESMNNNLQLKVRSNVTKKV